MIIPVSDVIWLEAPELKYQFVDGGYLEVGGETRHVLAGWWNGAAIQPSKRECPLLDTRGGLPSLVGRL